MQQELMKLFHTKEFWLRYFWILEDDFSYELLDEQPIKFFLSNEFCLSIDPGHDFSYISFVLKYNQEEFEIAWDDQAHPIPFVFRYDEFNILTTRISEINHLDEWIAKLLLIRFVGADNLSEFQQIIQLQYDLLKSSQLYSEQELDSCKQRLDQAAVYWRNYGRDAQWVVDPTNGKGWLYKGEDAYSLRSFDNTETDNTETGFPFPLWNRLIEQCKLNEPLIENICEPDQQDSLPREMDINVFDGVKKSISTNHCGEDLVPICISGKWGYINGKGEMVIPPRFLWAWEFATNDLATVEEKGKWGYINVKGETVIPLMFESAGPFADNNLAAIQDNKKWGYINAKGEVVIAPRFELAWPFSNGLAPVRVNGKWGYINDEGEMMIPAKYQVAKCFAGNGLAVVNEDWLHIIEESDEFRVTSVKEKFRYIDTNGETVIPPKFACAWGFASNGLAKVEVDRQHGYINAKGEMVISPRFEYALDFDAHGLAGVYENGKWGFINSGGVMTISPRFEYVLNFAANGLAAVKENGKYGYINTKGEMVVPPRFEDAKDFASNGLAMVSEDWKEGYINEKGQTVVFIDKAGGSKVLRNGDGEIVWQKGKGLTKKNSKKLYCRS